jgi:hypothetical protein
VSSGPNGSKSQIRRLFGGLIAQSSKQIVEYSAMLLTLLSVELIRSIETHFNPALRNVSTASSNSAGSLYIAICLSCSNDISIFN